MITGGLRPDLSTLWRGRRFLPLFVTQFLGAFNDNLLKNALVVLITYRLAVDSGLDAGPLVTMAAGIFILPFCLLSATAGQLADKYDRARIARAVKLAEVGIFAFALAGFALTSIPLLMLALFFLGVHSAFFGPVKYAVLPQYLSADELLSGNAYIGAATFIAILLGTIAGGLIVLRPHGPELVAIGGMGLAALGYLASRWMPVAPPAATDVRIDANIFAATWRSLKVTFERGALRQRCITISWFWFVGATYLAQLPVFCQKALHADETVVTLMLTLFSVGIGLGALLARGGARLQVWRGGAIWTAVAALGMAGFGVDLARTAAAVPIDTADSLRGIADLWAMREGPQILADLLLLSICGGAYVVPLYTALQREAPAQIIARTIGGLNVLNALFMVASALVALAILVAGGDVADILLLVAACNALAAVIGLRLWPQPVTNKATP